MLFTSTQAGPPLKSGSKLATRPRLAPGLNSFCPIDLTPLQESLQELVLVSAEAVVKSVQHFEADDVFDVGALPNCMVVADRVEAEGRALLTNSQLSSVQITDVTNGLKVATDMRCVARSAKQAAQLAWLIRTHPEASESLRLIFVIGAASREVAEYTSDGMKRNHEDTIRAGALAYRKVDLARRQAEDFLRSDVGLNAFSPELLRMTRAGVWFMALCGEGMARLGARIVL